MTIGDIFHLKISRYRICTPKRMGCKQVNLAYRVCTVQDKWMAKSFPLLV